MTSPPERTPIVLLPGMDGTTILLEPLMAALPPELPPHAVSYPIDGDNGYDALLPRVLAAIDAHPRCHLLGWSFSGPLALRAARARPDVVRSVTLVATFVQAPQPLLRLLGPLLVTPVVGLVRTLRRLPIWLLRPPHDPLRRAKARVWQTVPARTLAARTRAIRCVDARADLTAVQAPLLYLRSSADRVVPDHNVAQVQRLRPDVEVATLPGDHFALFGAAAAGARAIAGFVARRAP